MGRIYAMHAMEPESLELRTFFGTERYRQIRPTSRVGIWHIRHNCVHQMTSKAKLQELFST